MATRHGSVSGGCSITINLCGAAASSPQREHVEAGRWTKLQKKAWGVQMGRLAIEQTSHKELR